MLTKLYSILKNLKKKLLKIPLLILVLCTMRTIITNGLSAVQDNRIKKSVNTEYFEDIVVSKEIGVSKPNPEIFQHALNNINYTHKSKVLIVGDSLTSDIQGGIKFGIDTCWFNPAMDLNDAGIKPTYTIFDLMELKEILKN